MADVEKRFANLIRHARAGLAGGRGRHPGWDTGDELAFAEVDGGRRVRAWTCACSCTTSTTAADQLPEHAEIRRRGGRGCPFLIEHSFFLDTLWVRWHVAHDPLLANYFGYLTKSYEGEYWATQQKRLAEFNETVRHAGGRLVVVTFPFVAQPGAGVPPSKAIHAKLGGVLEETRRMHLDLLSTLEPHAGEGLTANRARSAPQRAGRTR